MPSIVEPNGREPENQEELFEQHIHTTWGLYIKPYNVDLAKKVGVDESIYLTTMASLCKQYHEKNSEPDWDVWDWFTATQNEIFEETALTPRQQTRILSDCITSGLMQVRKMGNPAQNYYKIDNIKYRKLLQLIV